MVLNHTSSLVNIMSLLSLEKPTNSLAILVLANASRKQVCHIVYFLYSIVSNLCGSKGDSIDAFNNFEMFQSGFLILSWGLSNHKCLIKFDITGCAPTVETSHWHNTSDSVVLSLLMVTTYLFGVLNMWRTYSATNWIETDSISIYLSKHQLLNVLKWDWFKHKDDFLWGLSARSATSWTNPISTNFFLIKATRVGEGFLVLSVNGK